jgi:two-component system, sensor histidine kinase and response regulator
LKGAAANLGVTTLAEAAARAEAAIDSKLSISPTLEELARTLDSAIGSIRAALPATAPTSSRAGTADPSTVAQPLTQLKKLLEADDGAASDFILGALAELSKVLSAAEIETLAGHVGNFAYLDALETLSSIAQRLSLNLG